MISANEGTVQALLGGLKLKARVQHPTIKVRTDRPGHPFFFRYWADEPQPDGTLKTYRKYHELGPSVGAEKITRKQAELKRDNVLAPLNNMTVEELVADGLVQMEKFVERFKTAHVTAQVGERYLLKKPSREKYLLHLDQKILPRWGKKRLCEIRTDEVQQWLFETCDSWWMMHDLRGLLSTIWAKAIDWGFWPEDRRTPISKVDIGRKWTVRPPRILTPEQTEPVLARLDDPNLLICETCLDTGTRISEVTGLKLKHVDLERGCIRIEQRNWRGDIDTPKTMSSTRTLALGTLAARYKIWIAILKTTDPEAWVFPKRGDRNSPLWDSGVRQALKKAAKDENCDFPGFGPHSLRRASITLRQEVGATSIEASKLAGHSKVNMTGEYTFVQLKRQDELTRKMQNLRAGNTSEKPADAGVEEIAAEPAA